MQKPDNTLIKKAKAVMKNAYAPYSKFRVGSAIKTDNGNYYSGCNVENAAYGLTCCAEHNAIGQMIAKGERRIKEIYIVSDSDIICTPCGGCRQIIREFSDATTKIYMSSCNDDFKTMTIDELLPQSFGPDMFVGKS